MSHGLPPKDYDGNGLTVEHVNIDQDMEKSPVDSISNGRSTQVLSQAPELVRDMTPERRIEAENALRRKIDLRLMPMVVIMYIMNYLDRNNIAAARLAGLESDTHLVGTQYQVRSRSTLRRHEILTINLSDLCQHTLCRIPPDADPRRISSSTKLENLESTCRAAWLYGVVSPLLQLLATALEDFLLVGSCWDLLKQPTFLVAFTICLRWVRSLS